MFQPTVTLAWCKKEGCIVHNIYFQRNLFKNVNPLKPTELYLIHYILGL